MGTDGGGRAGRGPWRGRPWRGRVEGWFQYYLTPKKATAPRLKLAMRYHLIDRVIDRAREVVPYVEATAGAPGTSLRVKEVDSTFTFVIEAGPGLSYFIADAVALNAGYRSQHISNRHTSHPNRGFNSDSGMGGVPFYFK